MGVRLGRRWRPRDGARLRPLPAHAAARRRARRRAHPRARDGRADVHRPSARRAAARGHGVGGPRARQGRPGLALQAGLGPRPAPPARGHPEHAPRRQRRLGGAVQLLLLDRPSERAHRRADDAAAALLRRPDRRDAARLRGGGLRAGGSGDDMSLTSQFLKVHERIYKATDGRVGHNMIGVPTLLLRTTGRKSGATRTNALVYARDRDDYLLVASNGGAPKHPAWLHNVRADPDVEIQVGRERRPARARVVEPPDPDYERPWRTAKQKKKHPQTPNKNH